MLPKSKINEEILLLLYKNYKEFRSNIMNNSTCPNKLDKLDEWATLNLNWHYYWGDFVKGCKLVSHDEYILI